MPDHQHDMIVIGGGPGGYVAAIRAAQLGLDVACVDENDRFGGTCLRVGCIPSKALLESSHLFEQTGEGLKQHGIQVGKPKLDLAAMLKRKDRIVETLTRGIASLLKKNKITAYTGRGRLTASREVIVTDRGGEATTLTAEHVIIATGSSPATLPGVELDGEHVVTSTEALSFDAPPKRLVVIGAGYIGLELGSVWRRLGSQVTVLEYLERILPGTDDEIAREAQKILRKQGIAFELGSRVTGVKVSKGVCRVEREGADAVECDRVLVAVGRKPHTEGLGLEEAGVETDERGRIRVGEGFSTNVAGVYAIGDVIAGPMLAHKASEEGVACVERIVTGYGHIDYDTIPGVCYTHPEIASVGRTERQLEEAGIAYRKGVFPFTASGRARTLGETDGRVKVLADAATDRVLGVHIIGPRAGDLIAEAVVAMDYAASSEDLARSPAAHPTLAETLKEAALAVDGRTIHM